MNQVIWQKFVHQEYTNLLEKDRLYSLIKRKVEKMTLWKVPIGLSYSSFLKNGVAEKHYRTWCNNCWEYGDVEDAKNKCEKWYLGSKCYLYKVGSRTMNDEFNKFKDKVVWDFWNTASDGTSPSFTTQKKKLLHFQSSIALP